jgi:predicted component of type VI protein secretion system
MMLGRGTRIGRHVGLEDQKFVLHLGRAARDLKRYLAGLDFGGA